MSMQYLDWSWEMHSNKYKHAQYWFSHSWDDKAFTRQQCRRHFCLKIPKKVNKNVKIVQFQCNINIYSEKSIQISTNIPNIGLAILLINNVWNENLEEEKKDV